MPLCDLCQARIEQLPEINAQVFDRGRRCILVGAERRKLGNKPWALLETLWARRTRAVHEDEIYAQLYGDDPDPPYIQTVKVHVCHLRKALRGSPYGIANVFGWGYRLVSVLETAPVEVRERPAVHLATKRAAPDRGETRAVS